MTRELRIKWNKEAIEQDQPMARSIEIIKKAPLCLLQHGNDKDVTALINFPCEGPIGGNISIRVVLDSMRRIEAR
jgi:hypothetical protein